MKKQIALALSVMSILGVSVASADYTTQYQAPAYLPAAKPAAPAPAPAPAPVVARADYYSASVYFDSDIDVPRADQAPSLAAALHAAQEYPTATVKLVGNADSSFNPEYNQGLSERRVQSVAQYLVNNGVDSSRIVGLANGDRKPAESNATPAGRAENRRVDVYINR
mgnify:FL=1